MKNCINCREQKSLTEFTKNKRTKDGLERRCRLCSNKRNKASYEKHKAKRLEKCAEYRENNKEYYREKVANWFKNNPDYAKEWSKTNPGASAQWYRDNPDKRRDQKRRYDRKRRAKDPMYKLSQNMRSRLWHFLKNKGWNKSSQTYQLIGCSWVELYDHLQKQLEPWMNESNYGKCIPGQSNIGWDIDHIIPIAGAKNEEDLVKLCHYTNLKPVCSNYNRYIKRDRLQN